MLVLLSVFRYMVYRFAMVETKNTWELVIENVIILGFLRADTSSKKQKSTYFEN